MKYIVRVKTFKIWPVIECGLRYDLVNALDVCDDRGALLIVEIRQALVAGDCLISQDSDDNIVPVLLCLMDNIKMPGMDYVCAHSEVD